MKILLAVLLILHGLIHLMGFAKGFQLAKLEEMVLPISRVGGVIWLFAFFMLLTSGLFLLMDIQIWWKISILGVVLSQFLILYSWQDAKYGSAANFLIAIGILSIG